MGSVKLHHETVPANIFKRHWPEIGLSVVFSSSHTFNFSVKLLSRKYYGFPPHFTTQYFLTSISTGTLSTGTIPLAAAMRSAADALKSVALLSAVGQRAL